MEKMSEIQLLQQLKTQLVNFLDELIDYFPEEPDFVVFRIVVKDTLPITDIMQYIVKNILPLQEMIKTRDEKVIEKHNILFEKFNEEDTNKVNYFRNMWHSPRMDADTKKVLWDWLDVFVFLANKYNDLNK